MSEFWRAWARPEGEVAVVDDGDRLSWAAFWTHATRTAEMIVDAVAAGGRVAVVGDNSCHTLIAHTGALLAARSPVPMSPRSTPDELAYLFDDADAAMVLAAPRAENAVRTAAATCGVAHLQIMEGSASHLLGGTDDTAIQVDLDRPAAPPLLYTSGTSGRPKGTDVRWIQETDGTVQDFMRRLVESVETFPRGAHVVAGPLYHNGPLLALRMIISGRPVVLRPRFDAEQFLSDISEHRAGSTVVVPTHLRRVMSLPPDVRRRYDVSSLGAVVLTGAACPADLKRDAISWFGPVIDEAYGGTESGTVCRISAAEWLDHPGSVGRPTPGFEVVVVDSDGKQVGPGVTGRLFFADRQGRGIRYHNDDEKTRQAHREPGVFTLGDVGHVDDEGYVYVTGRAVDMVVSGGVNLYPAEAERVINEHPDVEDVAVIGVPDPDMGEALLGIVVPRREARASFDVEQLDAFCRERLAPQKCPRRYELRGELPRNAMGKLSKAPLRDEYWGARPNIGG